MEELQPVGVVEVVCIGEDGLERWREVVHNMVVLAGRTDMLTSYFTGSGYTAAHYAGLKGAGTVASADVMSSHPGWSELTPYSNGTRPTITFSSASGGIINTSGLANFTINATATVAGAFITTSNTKGGTSGVLFAAADFGSPRDVLSGDTLNVSYQLTLS